MNAAAQRCHTTGNYLIVGQKEIFGMILTKSRIENNHRIVGLVPNPVNLAPTAVLINLNFWSHTYARQVKYRMKQVNTSAPQLLLEVTCHSLTPTKKHVP